MRRIARERPDILHRMLAGEYEYVAQAARAAGIIKEKPQTTPQDGRRGANAPEEGGNPT